RQPSASPRKTLALRRTSKNWSGLVGFAIIYPHGPQPFQREQSGRLRPLCYAFANVIDELAREAAIAHAVFRALLRCGKHKARGLLDVLAIALRQRVEPAELVGNHFSLPLDLARAPGHRTFRATGHAFWPSATD